MAYKLTTALLYSVFCWFSLVICSMAEWMRKRMDTAPSSGQSCTTVIWMFLTIIPWMLWTAQIAHFRPYFVQYLSVYIDQCFLTRSPQQTFKGTLRWLKKKKKKTKIFLFIGVPIIYNTFWKQNQGYRSFKYCNG